MMRTTMSLLALLGLGACSEGGRTNPPTEPAQPVTPVAAPSATGTGPSRTPGTGLRGTGPASFVGRWTADVRWCAAPQGDARPIDISVDRFEGYENSCAIVAIDETQVAYEATLACEAEGQRTTERVRMAVTGDSLALTYLDRRGGPRTTLTRCTTLGGGVPPGSPAVSR